MFSAVRAAFATERSRADVGRNLLAGLTVGIIALPLSMALAIASGVAPQHGLYTAMVAGVVIGLSGGSRVNISGPTAAFVVVLLPVVQQYGLGGLLLAGLIAGFILIGMGLLRLGSLIEIVPYPVVVGFTAGIGMVIATLQVKDFLGLQVVVSEGHYLDKLLTIVTSLDSIRAPEALVGVLTLTVLVAWPRLHTRLPGHLAALLAGTLLALLMAEWDNAWRVETLGTRFRWQMNGLNGDGIPPLLPAFDPPWRLPGPDGAPLSLSFELLKSLLPAAFTIAMLGAIESLLCAVVADGMSGKKHDPNDELIGQGLGNIVAPFFAGIPATAAIARTTANIRAGGTSPLSSVTHGVFILLAIVFLAPLLAFIPVSAMAALLLMVAWNMSEARHFLQTLRVAPRNDVLVLLVCFFLTVLFDMTLAVGVGMGLAAALFIRRSIEVTDTRNLADDHDNLGELREIMVYDINGPLFFGSAQKAVRQVAEIDAGTRVVVLNMSRVSMLDMTAIVAMKSIVEELESRQITLIVCELASRMRLKLRRAGIRQRPPVLIYARNLAHAQARAVGLLQGTSPTRDDLPG